jgi:MFS family permease
MKIFAHLGLSEVYSFNRPIIWTFAMLLFVTVILQADQNVLSPNIQAIEQEFGITDYEMGIIGSAFTLVAAVVTLAWGYLSDKYSRRWLLIGAVLLGEIPCFLTAFAQNYQQLLFLRVLSGIGLWGTVPVAFSLIGDLFTSKQRPTAQSWYQAFTAAGTLLGMLVAGFLGPSLGWRIPFIIISVPNFLFILGMVIFGSEPKRGGGEQEIRDLVLEGKTYRPQIRLRDYGELIRKPTNIWLFLQGIPGSVSWGVLPFFLIKYYQVDKGYTVELATLLLLVLGIGLIAGKLAGGIIGSKLYQRDVRLLPIFNGITTLVGIIPIWVMLSWPTPPVPDLGSLVGPAIFGFLGATIISIAGPNVQAMLMNVNKPEHRGAISSIFNLTDSIGAGLGPFVGGILSTSLGLGVAMKTSALFWIPCGLLFFVLVLVLPRDTQRLHREMESVRQEMERTQR